MRFAAASLQRNEQPVVLPCVRAAAVALRVVARGAIRERRARRCVRDHVAAGDVELGAEQPFELVGGQRDAHVLAVGEADLGDGAVEAVVREQLHGDLLEPQRLRDRRAHLPEQRRRVGCLVQRRRDGEQPLERVAVRLRARAFLCGLDGERRVLADGDEDVDLVAARAGGPRAARRRRGCRAARRPARASA